jgi:hypothetical protein
MVERLVFDRLDARSTRPRKHPRRAGHRTGGPSEVERNQLAIRIVRFRRQGGEAGRVCGLRNGGRRGRGRTRDRGGDGGGGLRNEAFDAIENRTDRHLIAGVELGFLDETSVDPQAVAAAQASDKTSALSNFSTLPGP